MLTRNTPVGGAGAPIIQYFKGSKQTEWRNEGESDWRTGLAGFAAEVGRYGDDFDNACAQAELPKAIVLHSFNQDPTEKEYWWFGKELYCYPLTSGPTATNISGLLRKRDETVAAGIAVRWPQEETVTRNGRTEVKPGMSSIFVRVYAQTLLEVGYIKPVQIGVRGPLSASFLDALLDHVRICQIADDMAREKSGPDAMVSLVEMCWPITRAEKPINVGRDQTSRVYEFASGHPGNPDRQYLAQRYITKSHREILEPAVVRDFPNAVEWAREFGTNHEGPVPSSEPGPASEPQQSNGVQPVAAAKNTPAPIEDDDDIPF